MSTIRAAGRGLVLAFSAAALLSGQVQISGSAYRVLGQADLRHNGFNRVEGMEMNAPSALAIDTRSGTAGLYVADAGNHRVLGWADARAYQAGDPPTVVLGQPSRQTSKPLGIGVAGLNNPAGMAVDPNTGNLYVADAGNHRVLRFPRPFTLPNRVEPDAVYGQPDLQTRTANTGGLGRSSMSAPVGVAFDAAGNLWVADTGNHRLLRFSAAVLDSASPEADLVLGQKDFSSNAANRGGEVTASGLNRPTGILFDQQSNLYVSDTGNARVLRFAAPFVSESAASGVYGQAGFGASALSTDKTMMLTAPAGMAVTSDGNLYVTSPSDNRVMVFAAAGAVGAPAANVLGQADFSSIAANAGVAPLAAAHTLSAPGDVKTDGFGNIYVADTGNNRVLAFSGSSRSASRVWGQLDFTANGGNQIKAGSLSAPHRTAIDYSQAPYALYVSDTANHRILIWRDSVRFRSGDPADLVIGQADLRTGGANIDTAGGRRPSASSLSSPKGITVDADGNLWVADSGNHRVLRFPRPVNQSGRITADVVLGQLDFSSSVSAAVTASSLRQPSSVVISSEGGIFVADTGNNRVLEYAPGAATGSAASRVYGQPGFYSAISHAAASAQTLNAPAGIAVDASLNLYVADTGENRVLIFPNTRDAPTYGAAASIVIGSDRFDTVARGASARRFNTVSDVAVAGDGQIYVADAGNSRVLVFPSLLFISISDAAASSVIGQRELTGAAANWNSTDGLATADALATPTAIFVDRQDTLYISDAGNSRVLHFLRAAAASHAVSAQISSLPRGGMITLAGSGLSYEEVAAGPPFASTLANREVVIDDEVLAPLAEVAPAKITLQLPSASPTGAHRIAVRSSDTNELIAGGGISIAAYAPGLFARVLNQDGSVNSASNPAIRGTSIRLTGSGQGPVTPVIGDGETAPEGEVRTVAVPTADGGTCLNSQPSVCVAVGNVFGDIQFSGLAANAVGTWQIDLKIPLNAPTGEGVALRAVINAIPSNVISVAIR